jgi:hypothetical protein
MARKRFTAEERVAYTPATVVEWRNGRHWHPGTVVVGVTRDVDGWESVQITNHATTATVSGGDRVDPRPGAVRLPQ